MLGVSIVARRGNRSSLANEQFESAFLDGWQPAIDELKKALPQRGLSANSY
jgi:hypothetical protein